ncbi:MAG: hypothetical protein D6816_10700 [Bacteroidetes bacterium]|nr:MAG: hypothetical protein D6816_10700 [Bacteroidota bacterium]
MIVKTMSVHEVADELCRHWGMSYSHAEALAEALELISDSNGEPIEFDPVAWRCDWSVYDTAVEAVEDLFDEDAIPEDLDEEEAIEMLQDEGRFEHATSHAVVVFTA